MFRRINPMFLLVPLIWLMGLWGFEQARPESDLLDSAYRALQLFALGYEADPAWFADGAKAPASLLLARALAGLSLVGAAVTLASARLRRFLALKLQIIRARRPRAVLLGLGRVNTAIAHELLDQGYMVTALDSRISPEMRRQQMDRNFLMLNGDLLDEEMLEHVRPDAADLVFVACGDDERSLEVAGRAAAIRRRRAGLTQGPGTLQADPAQVPPLPPVFAHVSNQRLLADVGDARDLGFDRHLDIRAFSLKTGAALDVMAHARLVETARELGQDRVHALICGMGNQGVALLVEMAQACHGAGLKPPRITILDRDAQLIKASLTASLTGLLDGRLPREARPQITFHGRDMRTLDFENDPSLRDLFTTAEAPTAVFLCCGDDTLNLGLAMRLETAMRRRVLPPRAIYARMWDAGDASHTGYRLSPLNLTRRFGMSSQTARNELRRRDEIERRAMLLHLGYQGVLDEISAEAQALRRAFDQDWSDLPDLVRRSNRRAARHLPSKLLELGLQWRFMNQAGLPVLAPEVAADLRRAFPDFTPSSAPSPRSGAHPEAPQDRPAPDPGQGPSPFAPDDLSDRLHAAARTEHKRWLVDRALEGLRQGPAYTGPDGQPRFLRDISRRWHDQFISFDALEQEQKDFDLTALRSCLSTPPVSETGRQRPVARWRNRLEVRPIELPRDTLPDRQALQDVTELCIAVPFSHVPFPPGRAQAVQDLVRSWARQEAAARLVLHLEQPEFERKPDCPRAPAADLASALQGLLPDGIVFDVLLRQAP